MSDLAESITKEDDACVQVAVRIRPQNAREKIDMCQVCTSVTDEEHQIVIGKDKAFTFDHVFDMPTQQDAIYNACIRALVDGCFEGYNATVFAYGQTGSGKTYTMGTGFELGVTTLYDEVGIIPRAVDHLFKGIEERRQHAFQNGIPAPEFKVTTQFMELYNEEVLDLMDNTRDPESRGRKSHIRIHEDAGGGIYVVGATTRPVASLDDTIECLRCGALSRATASTNMNVQSSRSHAIFTLQIRQHRIVQDENQLDEGKDSDSTQTEFETLTAKFHFVDLAGSERLKRTGATGDRQKEGISINCGLLALGNVISALGDKTKKGSHVPYRDSKLTRLLQDSLGGNSRTLMIACISPSDRDFMETLNTLKYANRAKNIKNKVMANQDKTSKQLASLRAEIARLTQELLDYKSGRCTVDADGVETVNDMVVENNMLQNENDKLRQRVKALQDTIETLKARNTQLMADSAIFSLGGPNGEATNEDVSNLIKKYLSEIEDLKSQLAESTALCEHMNKSSSLRSPRSSSSRMTLSSLSMMSSFGGGMEGPVSPDIYESSVLAEAKIEMKKMKKLKRSHSRNLNQESDKENVNKEEDGHNSEVFNEAEREGKSNANKKKVHDNKNNEEDGEAEDDDTEDVDNDDLATDSSSDSDSDGGDDDDEDDDEEDAESDNVHEDLANLTCEITIKQRLIEELEQTQKKMNSLKTHYEEKVTQLQLKIKETEHERDKVLSNIDKMSNSASESTKKVKQDFEKKLHSLQDELKKMQVEKKKHIKLQKNNTQYERHLKTLQHELAEMKKTKVRLMKQVKDEVEKNKHTEARRNKEMTQLRKEQLRRDNIIKTLERETSKKDAVLKRKQEEVEALRKRQKPMSSKAAGRVGKYDKPVTVPVSPMSQRRRRRVEFSPKLAKQKWDSLDKNITSVITKRQTITMLERDMDVWLRQRDKCTKQIEKYEQRKKEATDSKQPPEVLKKLTATIDDLSLKVEHAQENISECQSNIMQMEESKEEGDSTIEMSSMVGSLSLDESRYIIEKLYQQVLDKGQMMTLKESEVKELQGRLHQTELNNALQQDLLRHMMDDHVTIEVDDLMTHHDEMDDHDLNSSSSSSPADSMMESATPSILLPSLATNSLSASTDSLARREKARRRTATTQDLLYPGGGDATPALHPVEEAPEEAKQRLTTSPPSLPSPSSDRPGHGTPGQTTFATSSSSSSSHNGAIVISPASDAGGATGGTSSSESGGGGGSSEKLLVPPSRFSSLKKSGLPRPSPVLQRRGLSRSSSIGDTSSDTTPPSSPTMARRGLMSRSTDENVFSRLTSSTTTVSSPDPSSTPRGSIVPATSGRVAGGSRAPLSCTHTAEGHTKAVLSVCATDQLMFTGSKDRTVKSWDLGTGRELSSFTSHPNTVIKVAFCPKKQLLFSVCQSSVRVWDVRRTTDNCIKTLSSSGLTTNGSAAFTSRGSESSQHEHQINDIQLSPDGQTLFCGAGNVVQIWDLRRFSQAGKLCGHQAPVMALALTKGQSSCSMIISGSKDHYIKIFDVIEDAAGILWPKHNLLPPHYDGISSLALQGNILFSGSRDMCIKKWDITNQSLKHSINAAHKDWVCALDFVPGTNILVSGGRGGFLKLWHPESCLNLGEIKAHNSPINAITTNSSSIFTAANDGVGIWRHRASLDLSFDNLDLLDSITTPLPPSPS